MLLEDGLSGSHRCRRLGARLGLLGDLRRDKGAWRVGRAGQREGRGHGRWWLGGKTTGQAIESRGVQAKRAADI